MLIAVGGNSRKAGKTGVICALIRAIPEADWTAVKISPHAHEAPGSGGDTGRFLAAGARRALLLDSVPGEWPSDNVIVECGSVPDADVRLFVVDAAKEWKASARAALGQADVLVITGGEWEGSSIGALRACKQEMKNAEAGSARYRSRFSRIFRTATGRERRPPGSAFQRGGRPVFHAGPPLYESAELAAYIRALLNG